MKQGNLGKTDKGTGASGQAASTPARRTDDGQKRVNVDFPDWMVKKLDREADRIGVPRQSLIKMWIAERLDELAD